jgi:hypothetical protein
MPRARFQRVRIHLAEIHLVGLLRCSTGSVCWLVQSAGLFSLLAGLLCWLVQSVGWYSLVQSAGWYSLLDGQSAGWSVCWLVQCADWSTLLHWHSLLSGLLCWLVQCADMTATGVAAPAPTKRFRLPRQELSFVAPAYLDTDRVCPLSSKYAVTSMEGGSGSGSGWLLSLDSNWLPDYLITWQLDMTTLR